MMLDLFRLDGKTALVTGASRGLGRAMARGLAEAGADVVGVAREGDLGALQSEIERMGGHFRGVHADLARMDSVPRVLDATVAAFGHVDILVNNAAGQRRNAILNFTEEEWDLIFDLNVKTLYFLSREAAKLMLPRRGGKIINIASVLAFQGGYGVGAYTASKGAVAQLTKAMANELAPHGINVNAIAPGYFKTDMNEALLRDPARLEQIAVRIPAGRWGTPEDLQGAVVFLASAASDWIHGHVLVVDGGWMGR
jgi:2-dehydro-3-deoxy-D-gluconate 5-dehydrogenase